MISEMEVALFEAAAGLIPRQARFTRGPFYWVEYLGDVQRIAAEADNVYDLLKAFGERYGEQEEDGFDDYDFAASGADGEVMAALAGRIQDRNLRWAAITLLFDPPYDFLLDEYGDDPYFSTLAELFPDKVFVCGWSAVPPNQESAFGIMRDAG